MWRKMAVGARTWESPGTGMTSCYVTTTASRGLAFSYARSSIGIEFCGIQAHWILRQFRVTSHTPSDLLDF